MQSAELKSNRKAMHLTQAELGEWLGMSRETINRWEREKEPMPAWLVFAISGLASALNEMEDTESV